MDIEDFLVIFTLKIPSDRTSFNGQVLVEETENEDPDASGGPQQDQVSLLFVSLVYVIFVVHVYVKHIIVYRYTCALHLNIFYICVIQILKYIYIYINT